MKVNKIHLIVVIVLMLVVFATNIYGAGSFSVSISNASMYVGNTATLTIKTNNCAGKFNVTSSNSSVITVSTSSIWVDGTVTLTVTAKANGTANIVVTASDVSDTDLNDVKGSKSVSVTVKTKQTSSSGTTNVSTSNKKPTTSNKKDTVTKPSTSSNNNQKTSNTQSVLNSNAYLKEFRVDQPGISPDFNKNTYNYDITVGENIDKLDVTAIPEDSKATVSVSGNTDLKIGESRITTKVVAEDKKTSNTYTITVTKTEDAIKSSAYLQNIIVTNLSLTPEFSKEILEYDLGSVSADVDKIEVFASAENENAKVEVMGNDNLVSGENIVKITVTSENGNVQKTYTLKLNKEKSAAEIEKESKEAKKSFKKAKRENMKAILKEKAPVILLYFFVWVEFLQVIYLYEKLKKAPN